MRPKKKNRTRGFTLVELMIAVAISSVLVYMMYVAFRTGDEQMHQMDMKMLIQANAREGLYKMLQELRQTNFDDTGPPITITNGGDTITFPVPDSVAPVDANYNPNWSGNLVSYDIVAGQIIRTQGAAQAVIANDVTDVDFARAGNVITITLDVQRAMRNGRLIPDIPLQITAQAEIRNPDQVNA